MKLTVEFVFVAATATTRRRKGGARACPAGRRDEDFRERNGRR